MMIKYLSGFILDEISIELRYLNKEIKRITNTSYPFIMFVMQRVYQQGNNHHNSECNDVIDALNYRNPCARWVPVC